MRSEARQTDDRELRATLITRIFYIQLLLVLIAAALIPVSVYAKLGWFWICFLAGVFGASIAMLRTVTRGGDIKYLSQTRWPLLLSPLLYGGILAGIAYLTLGSGLLSDETGDGILKTNLFPAFGPEEIVNDLAYMKNYLKIRPSSLPDAAKLVIWCLIAGFSENFITGILSTLERQASSLVQSEDSQSE